MAKPRVSFLILPIVAPLLLSLEQCMGWHDDGVLTNGVGREIAKFRVEFVDFKGETADYKGKNGEIDKKSAGEACAVKI